MQGVSNEIEANITEDRILHKWPAKKTSMFINEKMAVMISW